MLTLMDDINHRPVDCEYQTIVRQWFIDSGSTLELRKVVNPTPTQLSEQLSVIVQDGLRDVHDADGSRPWSDQATSPLVLRTS